MSTTARRPTTRTLDYGALVQQVAGKEHERPETVYRFSNGREFKSTDRSESGIYRRS